LRFAKLDIRYVDELAILALLENEVFILKLNRT